MLHDQLQVAVCSVCSKGASLSQLALSNDKDATSFLTNTCFWLTSSASSLALDGLHLTGMHIHTCPAYIQQDGTQMFELQNTKDAASTKASVAWVAQCSH